jgi:hypothetical protein
MTDDNGRRAANSEEHRALVEELQAAISSERVQAFLDALQGIEVTERDAILDKVLSGPPSMRVDLGLPPDIQIARRFVGGPVSEFAVSKRARSGALVTIFVKLSQSSQREFRQVIPWHPSEN